MSASLGGYELVGRVSTGSSVTVWKARDHVLARDLAIKQVPLTSREMVDRMREEAATLAGLADDHIVEVYGFFEEDGTACLVERWIEGATLASVIATGARLTTPQSLGVVRGALLGLTHAHQRGVVHGDVSAGNILIDTEGISRLIDFGRGGHGTPAYRSPEAAEGGSLQPTADVYAAAAVLVHLLTGSPGTADRLGGIDAALRPLPARAMSAQPDLRHPDAAALLADLAAIAERTYGAIWWTQVGVGSLVPPAIAILTGVGAGAGVAGGGAAQVLTSSAGAGAAGGGALTGATGGGLRLPLIIGAAVAGTAIVAGVIALAQADNGNAPQAVSASSPTASAINAVASTSPTPEPPSPKEVLEASQPSGKWRVQDSGRNFLFDGSSKKLDKSTATTWTIPVGDCTAKACAGTIKSSSGARYDYRWNGRGLSLTRAPVVSGKLQCYDDVTGDPVPLSETSYIVRTSYKYGDIAISGPSDAPTRFTIPVTTTYAYRFIGDCEQSPDSVVRSEVVLHVSRR
ncbi:hypothetical protein BH11ACT8_BH11ACT8_18420 [soil metagenome]